MEKWKQEPARGTALADQAWRMQIPQEYAETRSNFRKGEPEGRSRKVSNGRLPGRKDGGDPAWVNQP